MGFDEAAHFAKANFQFPPAAVDKVVFELKGLAKATQQIDQAVVNREGYSDSAWYVGPLEQGHWATYLNVLKEGDAHGLDTLAEETSRITALLADPNARGTRRKGLVMGNVQSGKTRNFAGVIAKATDAGYKLVIVLSGMHNNLREQTQSRLDSQLFSGPDWYPLTTPVSDFEHPAKPSELFLHQPALCAVVKKNANRLEKLVAMLNDPAMKKILPSIPVLIVDDEADQATPNSMREKEQVSTINQLLRDLWASITTGSYVAYTATPFANVLMDPDNESDLFPSDFITTIQPGQGYFGAERVFGLSETVPDQPGIATDGLDMVREIPKAEAELLRPPSNKEERAEFDREPPPSMLHALEWFIVATAVRRTRGQYGHSSMLVHTTHYALPHFAMKQQLEFSIEDLRASVRRGDLTRLTAAWQREALAVSDQATEPLPTWPEVASAIPDVLDQVGVIVDNGDSHDRLNYDEKQGRTVVAVGGGTLSRGLTLEGLVVSYFTRTSNAYDTLLQMGRWFGYREGYEDLPRIWVTEGLDKEYAFLARVEKDLRDEIESVQASEFTPEQVGVKIRAHPGRLAVTASNRMYDAKVVQLGLSGTANQTFILNASTPSITQANIAATESLLAGSAVEPTPWPTSRYMATGVPGNTVVDFVRGFRVHDSQAWLSPENRKHITDWISKWAAGPIWNVVLVSNSTPQDHLGTITVAGRQLDCLDRSPLINSTPDRIDLKAVMSAGDRLADIDPKSFPFRPTTEADRRKVRRQRGNGSGLLLIYPLSANASAALPVSGKPARMDMPADHHFLAFAIVYPVVNDEDGKQGSFISVRRNWDVPDVVEGDEDSALKEEE